MYPVTAGGFQANRGQSPNLQQGNMVFGFFLDGQDQQVPVIMGVLGNNSQTVLSQKIGLAPHIVITAARFRFMPLFNTTWT
ncbi:MAG: hypothetical protein EBZ11_08295 [Alphaproteobacteria bacterium]|nr:hypothetical protein [Alphaproteobacteria bacterium]